jgi:hypothetical protein
VPLPSEALNLLGGVYRLEHNRAHPSFLQVPTAPASAYGRRCGICR